VFNPALQVIPVPRGAERGRGLPAVSQDKALLGFSATEAGCSVCCRLDRIPSCPMRTEKRWLLAKGHKAARPLITWGNTA